MFDFKEIENIDIDKNTKKIILNFCEAILKITKTKIFFSDTNSIVSICLYGRDNNNILFVLNEEVAAKFFYETHKITKMFRKKNLVPLCMTRKHITTSQDVFPLEFLEIKNSYQLIYGEDIFSSINIMIVRNRVVEKTNNNETQLDRSSKERLRHEE